MQDSVILRKGSGWSNWYQLEVSDSKWRGVGHVYLFDETGIKYGFKDFESNQAIEFCVELMRKNKVDFSSDRAFYTKYDEGFIISSRPKKCTLYIPLTGLKIVEKGRRVFDYLEYTVDAVVYRIENVFGEPLFSVNENERVTEKNQKKIDIRKIVEGSPLHTLGAYTVLDRFDEIKEAIGEIEKIGPPEK